MTNIDQVNSKYKTMKMVLDGTIFLMFTKGKTADDQSFEVNNYKMKAIREYTTAYKTAYGNTIGANISFYQSLI